MSSKETLVAQDDIIPLAVEKPRDEEEIIVRGHQFVKPSAFMSTVSKDTKKAKSDVDRSFLSILEGGSFETLYQNLLSRLDHHHDLLMCMKQRYEVRTHMSICSPQVPGYIFIISGDFNFV